MVMEKSKKQDSVLEMKSVSLSYCLYVKGKGDHSSQRLRWVFKHSSEFDGNVALFLDAVLSDLVFDASRFTSLFAHSFFNPSRSWMPVHTAVGILDTREYMPRLSLLYGTLTKEEKKAAQEKAYLLDESINGMNFQVSRLALWITDREDKGNLETWKLIAECSLSRD
ncbi:hypothetical protein D5086_002843 [Populus alba]|uniref:Uncharacterized protein n=1 Tax=Populus alba TaxID=43335 RepID=A0ACC4D3V1_POPAL